MSPAPDATTRFTSRVDDYVRARPTYPRAVLDTLRDRISFEPSWTIADVGAGTGISTRLFLGAGCRVLAVEPNAAMLAAAEREFAGNERFTGVDATAEATTLADGSIDLVVAAQAFHWFDADAFRAECVRILRPDRRHVLLMWNDRRTEGSEFGVAYEQMLLRLSDDYAKVNHRNVNADPERFHRFFAPGTYQLVTLPNAQTLDFAGLRARLLSSSYAPPAGHPNHEPMLDELRSIFDRTASAEGTVTVEYVLELHLGRVDG